MCTNGAYSCYDLVDNYLRINAVPDQRLDGQQHASNPQHLSPTIQVMSRLNIRRVTAV